MKEKNCFFEDIILDVESERCDRNSVYAQRLAEMLAQEFAGYLTNEQIGYLDHGFPSPSAPAPKP
ncbi:hypothetical protein [Mesorhizobium sp. M0011]|uniref:hypothetical protein n=1 Tax=Mesorhizobium sp. M0011 TaxID=2956839 RepID=UPI00333AB105